MVGVKRREENWVERTAVDCEMRGFPTLLFSLALLFPLFFVGQESQLQHKFCDSKNRTKMLQSSQTFGAFPPVPRVIWEDLCSHLAAAA